MSQLKRTALYPLYSEYGAKTVNFGGWDMPVQFSSIKEEHFAVREHAGLFDVSHMGEAEVKGKGALSLLQKIATNDVSKLSPGKAQYTLMCYENGGTVDDLLIYMLAEDHYFLVLNAANTDKDIKWLHKFADDTVTVTDVSNEYSLLAIQGPKAEKIVQSITEINVSDISFFRFLHQADLGGVKALLSRTGYTGKMDLRFIVPLKMRKHFGKHL
nr:glycine cleavage system aminomethyltransferase GcvT [Thalassobacillus sp. C254]